MNVTGNVLESINRASLANGATFLLKEKCPGLENVSVITIPTFWALPTYCPWIQYKLELTPPQGGSIYKVKRVISCSPLPVTIKKGEKLTKVKSLQDVEKNSSIYYQLKPRFAPKVYFKLLPYFSADFLLKYNVKQLTTLYYVLKRKPFLFCFWDVLKRVLYQVEWSGFSKERGDLDIQWNMIAKDNGYSKTCPTWSFERLLDCEEDVKYPLQAIKTALSIYCSFLDKRFLFGDERIMLENGTSEDVVEFLKREGILMQSGEYLVRQEIEILELSTVMAIKKKNINIEMYDFNYYGTDYTSELSYWYTHNDSEDILFLSANHPTTFYLVKTTGIDALCIQNFKNFKKIIKKKKRIAIDRFHKTSLQDFYNIVKNCQDGATVTLFCDLEDYPANSKRGTGDVAFQVSQIPNIKKTEMKKWDKGHPLFVIYNSFTNPSGVIFKDIYSIPLEKSKTFQSDIKGSKTKPKDKKEEDGDLDFQIFCSDENGKKILRPLLKNPKILNSHTFFMQQCVWIMETDDFGKIKKVVRNDAERDVVMKFDAKAPIELKSGTVYTIEIASFGGTRKYRTDKYTFCHTDVLTISHYAGPPFRCCLFTIGEKTNRRHMANAAKYTDKEMKIYTTPEVKITLIKNAPNYKSESGLGEKFHSFLSQ